MVRLSDPFTQVIILGLVCFCCPGMFNAISGTGAFGLSDADANVGVTADIVLGALFALSSLAAGGLFNIFGHRLLLILGGLTYVLYVASYLAYDYIHSMAFCFVSAALLGIGAGWLWCAQGAIMMGYPVEGDKGKYFGVFWAIFNTGGLLGGLIPVIAQWNDTEAPKASTATYAAFMCIMAFGSFLSILLLPASKVTRSDGSPVVKVKFSSAAVEVQGILGLFKDWRMLALFPMFFTSNWFYTYQQTAVNGQNGATMRTRAFGSVFYWGAQIVASLAYGAILDKASWTRTTRARYGLIILSVFMAVTWGGGLAYQTTFGPEHTITVDGKIKVDSNDFHKWDLVNTTSQWIGPFILYFMYGACDAMFQAYAYWLMGSLTNDINVAARYSGFYKFAQNIGGVLRGFVMKSAIGNVPDHPESAVGKGMGEILVCVILVALSLLFAVPVAWRAVKDTTDEEPSEYENKEEFDDVKA